MSTPEAMRAPTEGDVAEVARLMSEHSPEPMDEDGIRRTWTSPNVDLAQDARLEDGRAYVLVEGLGEDRVWIDLRGNPSPDMLDWAETRAREKGSRLFAGGWATNEALLLALEEGGFRLIRHSHRMEIDLSDPPPAPAWPEGVEVRTFRAGDERIFYALQQQTFEDSWEPVTVSYEEWTHWYLGSSPRFVPDLWFLAVEGEEPAGFALCHPHPADAELGWVGELGVRRQWRRRGVGRALLLQAFAAFRERGLARVGLGVDAESLTGASRLYERAGMRVLARFDVYEKAVA